MRPAGTFSDIQLSNSRGSLESEEYVKNIEIRSRGQG